MLITIDFYLIWITRVPVEKWNLNTSIVLEIFPTFQNSNFEISYLTNIVDYYFKSQNNNYKYVYIKFFCF